MQLFYEPRIEELLHLSEEESKHAVRVLRLGVGDSIKIIDGKGHLFDAEITDPNPKTCRIRIRSVESFEEQKPYAIHLAIAPTKDLDRIEWMLEKCVEIGVDTVTFLLTKRTDERYWKGKSLHLDRLERIAVSAMKQSYKCRMPRIEGLIPWKQFLDQLPANTQKFIGHLEENRKSLKESIVPGGSYVILIGPEGDFTAEEITQANENGFLSVTMGESRLRTETAGLVAVHTITILNED